MTPKEKFENVVQMIERKVCEPGHSSQEIATEAARSSGLQLRDMSTVFGYLLDTTLNSYIMTRKLMAAYSFLVKSEKMDSIHAVDLAGYADQPSFHKAFKKLFNMTPKEAFNKKDTSKYIPAISWDMLSGGSTSQLNKRMDGTELKESTTFGIPDSSFSVLTEVLDLESFYGLPRRFSEYAYELSKSTGHTMQDCFRYADSLHEYCGDLNESEEDQQSYEEELHEVADDQMIQTVFFSRGISVTVLVELRDTFGASLEDLMKCDMIMLSMFPGFERTYSMKFSYYVRAYEYYAKHLKISEDDHWFNAYLDEIMVGTPIEIAFENVYPFAAAEEDDDYGEDSYTHDDFDEGGRYSIMERLAEEESRWHGRRIDTDLFYDPDNPAYTEYPFDDDEEEY